MFNVGEIASNFQGAAVLPQEILTENFDFFDFTEGKKALLFFYPLDFTFVCPSELWALNEATPRFLDLNTQPIAISIDSVYAHWAWQRTPAESGGLQGLGALRFPMVSDIKQEICRLYGVQHSDGGIALRASVLVDESKVIRHISINDLPLGRNIDELVRLVEALSHHEAGGKVCPAGWQPGQAAMEATREGAAHYLTERLQRTKTFS